MNDDNNVTPIDKKKAAIERHASKEYKPQIPRAAEVNEPRISWQVLTL